MRVICIDDKERPGDYPTFPNIKEGCIYNIVCSCKGYGKDGSVVLSYKLKEFDQKYCWDCDRFIPLSDVSEKTMHRDYDLKKKRSINS